MKLVVSETISTQLNLPNRFHHTDFLPQQLGQVRFLSILPRCLHLPPSTHHLRCILIRRNSLIGRLRALTVAHRRSQPNTPARLRLHTQLQLLVVLRIHRHRQERPLPHLIIPLRNLPKIHLRLLLLLGFLHLPVVLPRLQDLLMP